MSTKPVKFRVFVYEKPSLSIMSHQFIMSKTEKSLSKNRNKFFNSGHTLTALLTNNYWTNILCWHFSKYFPRIDLLQHLTAWIFQGPSKHYTQWREHLLARLSQDFQLQGPQIFICNSKIIWIIYLLYLSLINRYWNTYRSWHDSWYFWQNNPVAGGCRNKEYHQIWAIINGNWLQLSLILHIFENYIVVFFF